MAINKDFFRGKNVLITGGAGFIGSSLCIELVKMGSKVTVIDALLPLYGGNLFNLEEVMDKIKFIEGDIRDKELVNNLVKGQDLIFDLAAQVSYIDSRDLPFLDFDINGLGHMNVLEAARLYASNATYIFSSSRLVYGKLLTNPVNEEHPTKPLSLYAIHKLLVERYCEYYFKTFGLKTMVVRLPNPYGVRQQMKHNKYSLVGWFLRQAMEGGTITIFGDGKQARDYLYIDDIVEGFLLLAEKGRGGEVYNMGSKEKMTFVEMVDAVLKEVKSGKKEHIPWPEHYEKNETGDYFADTTKIKKHLGWEAKTDLRTGIRKMVDYYKENRGLYSLSDDSSNELAIRDYTNKKYYYLSEVDKERLIKRSLKKLKVGSGTADYVKEIIGSLKDKKILDAGSGLGIVSLGFAKKEANVTGIEEDKILVSLAQYIAQANKLKINFIYSGLTSMPFPANTFDVVISIDVLNRISNCQAYLGEITRVLKSGGIAIASFPTVAGKILYNREINVGETKSYSIHSLNKELKNMSSKHGRLILNQNVLSKNSGIKRVMKKALSIIGLPHTALLPQAVLTLIKK